MHSDFSMPSPGSIKGRASSITAAFVQAIVPAIEPSDREVDEVLGILGMRRGECRCAYCGDSTTEWDHFRPLVTAKRPTGYITEIANLVPACGKCNQSKGNKSWKDWIRSEARRSPATRRVPDLEEKIRRLEDFERWRTPTRIDFEVSVGPEFWRAHWDNLARFFALMDECEIHARALRLKIEQKWANKSLQPTATAVTPPAAQEIVPAVAVAEH
jgi:hypothetical protein